MKKIFYLALCLLFTVNSQAAMKVVNVSGEKVASIEMKSDATTHATSYKAGKIKKKGQKKLGFFKKMKLKIGQKFLKKKANKKGGDISQGLYIVLAIFFLGWLAMGVLDDWEGNNWIIALLLYVILWLPGFVYSLIKMGDYY